MSDLVSFVMAELVRCQTVDSECIAFLKVYVELNSFCVDIQFTYELEMSGSINFLDMTVFRNETRLSTSWYRKSY